MKKIIIFLLLIGVCLSTGCSIPMSNDSSNMSDSSNQENTIGKTQNDTTGLDNGQSTVDQNQTIPTKPNISVTIYYQDAGGLIIPISRKIDRQEGIARAAITGLIDNSNNREEIGYYGIFPVLPQGTEIKGINIKEGTATIDFNDKLLSYGSQKEEQNIISSIVYTLTEFKTVQNVKILVNGREKGKLKYETDISGILNRDNVLINSKIVNLEQKCSKADIYLFDKVNENNYYLLPVSKEYSGTTENLPGKIIELFGENFGSSKLFSQLPQKVILKNVIIKDDVMTLDFSKDLTSYGGGTEKETGIINQILYSMKQVKGLNKMKILVEGKENALPEGTIVSEGMPFPTVINNVMDK